MVTFIVLFISTFFFSTTTDAQSFTNKFEFSNEFKSEQTLKNKSKQYQQEKLFQQAYEDFKQENSEFLYYYNLPKHYLDINWKELTSTDYEAAYTSHIKSVNSKTCKLNLTLLNRFSYYNQFFIFPIYWNPGKPYSKKREIYKGRVATLEARCKSVYYTGTPETILLQPGSSNIEGFIENQPVQTIIKYLKNN